MTRSGPPTPTDPSEPLLLGEVHRTRTAGTTSGFGRLADPHAGLPEEGAVIGEHYRLVRRLGEGMFGRVFVAERTDVPEHRVALKVMTRAVYEHRDVERELVMLAAASHPHIVQLKDHGVTRDFVWLTMPLYEGETLAQRLERGPLSLREAHDVFVPIARGMQALHERGLRHQDIKPENIFLARFSDRSYPVLLDLGVAVERTSPFVAGTVLYASPEQVMALAGLATGSALDERMDTYCLATTLIRALTGTPSDEERAPRTPLEIAAWFERRDQFPLPEGSLDALSGGARERLIEALRHWLHRIPALRATAREMAEGLEVLLEPEREAARDAERAVARQRTSLQRVRIALAAMAFAAAGAGFYTFSKRETLRLASELERVRDEGAASFDQLDTCVAAHDLEHRKLQRCDDERRTAEEEHLRALANVAAGNETAVQSAERTNAALRARLLTCQDEAEAAETQWLRDRSELEAVWTDRGESWANERATLRDEIDATRRSRDSVIRARDDLQLERDALLHDRDAIERDRDDIRKARSSCDATLASTADSAERCRRDLGICMEEARTCQRLPAPPPPSSGGSNGAASPSDAPAQTSTTLASPR